jgi:glucan phosphoethanolaminetransferase (alkaline phosphatase superfamily)
MEAGVKDNYRQRILASIAVTLLVWPVLAQLGTSDLAEASLGKRLFILSYSASVLAVPLLLLPIRVSIGLLSPLAFLGWAEGWHILHNQSSVTEGAWAASIGTNPSESMEFLRTVWLWFAAGLMSFGYCVFFALRSNSTWKHPRRAWAFVPVVVLLVAAAFDMQRFGSEAKTLQGRFEKLLDFQLMRWERIYPTGPILKLHKVLSERSALVDAKAQLAEFRFGAHFRTSGVPGAQIVVFVIGEATRSDHLSTCGYARATMPLLQGRDDIFWFCNAIAPANLTHKAVPFLTKRSTPMAPEVGMRERSLLRAFSEVGFHTAWISNQPIHSGGSLETQLIASDADTVIGLNENMDAPSWDRVVLPSLSNLLTTTSKPLFLTVQLMGCHLRYNWRYPPDREIFTPALRGSVSVADFDASHKTEIVNAYDNAVLEQDFVLDSLLRMVKRTARPAIVVFVPDHGENLFDPPHGRILHGSPVPTPQEIQVPLMVWTSSTDGSLDSTTLRILRTNQSKRVCASQAMPTLLDAAGISVPGSDPSTSLLQPALGNKNCPIASPTGEMHWSDDLLRGYKP